VEELKKLTLTAISSFVAVFFGTCGFILAARWFGGLLEL
jgi:hypothetical protein